MNTFGQSERGGHHHHHHHHSKRHSSIQTLTTPIRTSTKTDPEKVKYSFDDTPKTRKIKFMFRVKRSLWIYYYYYLIILDV
jgi:G3E family GTPase